MNRNKLPMVMMLSAGAVTAIMMFLMNYELTDMLIALLVVLLIFLMLGSFLKYLLNKFDKENAKKALEEGEVIEKEVVAEGEEKEDGKEETKE